MTPNEHAIRDTRLMTKVIWRTILIGMTMERIVQTLVQNRLPVFTWE